MENDSKIVPLRSQAPLTSASGSLPSFQDRLRPAEIGQIIAELTICLALVRPVGMSSDEAEMWLRAAAQSVNHYPFDILREAAANARRTCDHHSKIVPAIVAAAEPDLVQRRRLASYNPPRPRLVEIAAPEPEPAKPITQADCDRMPEYLVSLGLTAGFLIRNADGTVSPAPEGAA